jgi:NADH:ubiquinone oxidoreductase subunit K
VVIKILFVLLVVCTAALVAVGIAVLLRVRRHLKQEELDAQARPKLDDSESQISNDRHL